MAQEDFAENSVRKIEVMTFRWKADLIHNFGSVMKCSFPEYREGSTKWTAEIGDCVQDFFSEALCLEYDERERAERIMKTDCSSWRHLKQTKLL